MQCYTSLRNLGALNIMCVYRNLIRPLLFQLDPEQSHRLAYKFIGNGAPVLAALSNRFTYPNDDLQVSIFGTILSNPIGLAQVR